MRVFVLSSLPLKSQRVSSEGLTSNTNTWRKRLWQTTRKERVAAAPAAAALRAAAAVAPRAAAAARAAAARAAAEVRRVAARPAAVHPAARLVAAAARRVAAAAAVRRAARAAVAAPPGAAAAALRAAAATSRARPLSETHSHGPLLHGRALRETAQGVKARGARVDARAPRFLSSTSPAGMRTAYCSIHFAAPSRRRLPSPLILRRSTAATRSASAKTRMKLPPRIFNTSASE